MNKTIAFFVISTELGGAEKSLLAFLIEFSQKHKSIIVFTPKDTGPLIDELNRIGITYNTIPLPHFILSLSRKRLARTLLFLLPAAIYSLYYLFVIQKKIHSNDIKTIHSTGIKFHILLCLLSLFNKNKHFHIHVRDIINISQLKIFFTFFSRLKNVHFIFNSKVTAQSLPKVPPLVIYNGFNPTHFKTDSSALKKNLGIDDRHTLIAVVGVIARWKGQREFLKMASQLSHKFKHLHFLIVGDEIYDTFAEEGELSILKKMSADLGLTKNLHFLGFQRDIGYIYHGIDILVHSSIEPEPFGRVIVESMICGCPVIASNKGGPLEIIDDKKNGFLYKQADVDDMVSVISPLIESQDLRASTSQAGRLKAKDFSMENYVSKLGLHLLNF